MIEAFTHPLDPTFRQNKWLAHPSQIFVPVTADGSRVLDNGGDVIAICFTTEMAHTVARLLNEYAGRT